MENDLKVKCPLCDGHGDLTRAEMAEKFATPDLRKRLDARITQILENVNLAAAGPRVHDFQKEVHEWNPQLPMWRRSPKE